MQSSSRRARPAVKSARARQPRLLALTVLAIAIPAWTQDAEPTREELERIIIAQQRLLNDWAGLTRYGSDNSELRLKDGETRIVFFGDEITENWAPKYFAGKLYFNRGVTGQTTPQMLVRFRQDVIELKPKVVVIQGGSNDIAGVAGPMTQGTAAENFMSMVELAKLHGIRVVISSMTPVCNCSAKDVTKYRTPGKLMGMNGWLKEFAEKNGLVYLDYYSALVQGRAFKKELTEDGLIPNAAGYEIMAKLADKAIAAALSKN